MESVNQLEQLARRTLQKENDATYIVPSHYLRELHAHLARCPGATNFSVKPGEDGSDASQFGTLICLEDGCSQTLELQNSFYGVDPRDAVCFGDVDERLGGLVHYTKHIFDASAEHKQAAERRWQAEQAERSARNEPLGPITLLPWDELQACLARRQDAQQSGPSSKSLRVSHMDVDGTDNKENVKTSMIANGRDATSPASTNQTSQPLQPINATPPKASTSTAPAPTTPRRSLRQQARENALWAQKKVSEMPKGVTARKTAMPSDQPPATDDAKVDSGAVKKEERMEDLTTESNGIAPQAAPALLVDEVDRKPMTLPSLDTANEHLPAAANTTAPSPTEPTPQDCKPEASHLSSALAEDRKPVVADLPASVDQKPNVTDLVPAVTLSTSTLAPILKAETTPEKPRFISVSSHPTSDDSDLVMLPSTSTRFSATPRSGHTATGPSSDAADDEDEDGLDEAERIRRTIADIRANRQREDAMLSDEEDDELDELARARGRRAGSVEQTIEEFTRQTLSGTDWDTDTDIGRAREALGLTQPESFITGTNIKPYPYQCIGIYWALKKEEERRGGIFADEMGLGKTIAMISLIALSPPPPGSKRKTTLIICPMSLLSQWKEEINDFTDEGTYSILIYHGANKAKKTVADLAEYGVIITTYDSMKFEWHDEKVDAHDRRLKEGPLMGMTFWRIILDEAHVIRNQYTRCSKAVCALRGRYRWCLTGTPLINSLTDAYGYIKFLKVQKWMDWPEFRNYITKKEKKNGRLAAERISVILRPLMIRRTKESKFNGRPILVLPNKAVEQTEVRLSLEEREIYDAIEKGLQVRFNKFLKADSVMKNYAHILAMLQRLRMCVNHPALCLENREDAFETPEEQKKREEADIARAKTVCGEAWVENLKKKRLERALRDIDRERNGEEVEDDGSEDCPICRDQLKDAKIASCSHIFCTDCITEVFNTRPTLVLEIGDANDRACPCCRAALSLSRLFTLSSFEPSEERIDVERKLRRMDGPSQKKKQKGNATPDSEHDRKGKAKKEEPSSPFGEDVKPKIEKGGIIDITSSESESEDDLPDLPVVQVKKEQKSITVKTEAARAVKSEKKESSVKAGKRREVSAKPKRIVAKKSKTFKRRAAREDSYDSMDDFIVSDDDDGTGPSRPRLGKKRNRAAETPSSDEESDGTIDSDSQAEDDDLGAAAPGRVPLPPVKTMSKFIPSAKMVVMLEYLRELEDDPDKSKDKVIIMSQFTSMLDLVADYLMQEGFTCEAFDGRMNMEDKDEAIRKFKKKKRVKILLLSLRAGGVGLNLTVASQIINLDPAWNFAVEDQGYGRAHRIGQRKEVMIKRTIAKDTIDERMLELQSRKTALVDAAIGEGAVKRSGRLTREDLIMLFGLGARAQGRAIAEAPALLNRQPPRPLPGRVNAARRAGMGTIMRVAARGLDDFNGMNNMPGQ